MKKWSKVHRLKGFDVLVQRLVNKSDGEHVHVTIRFSEGQYVMKIGYGDEEGSFEEADKAFENYSKEDAQKFVDSFNIKIHGK